MSEYPTHNEFIEKLFEVAKTTMVEKPYYDRFDRIFHVAYSLIRNKRDKITLEELEIRYGFTLIDIILFNKAYGACGVKTDFEHLYFTGEILYVFNHNPTLTWMKERKFEGYVPVESVSNQKVSVETLNRIISPPRDVRLDFKAPDLPASDIPFIERKKETSSYVPRFYNTKPPVTKEELPDRKADLIEAFQKALVEKPRMEYHLNKCLEYIQESPVIKIPSDISNINLFTGMGYEIVYKTLSQ